MLLEKLWDFLSNFLFLFLFVSFFGCLAHRGSHGEMKGAEKVWTADPDSAEDSATLVLTSSSLTRSGSYMPGEQKPNFTWECRVWLRLCCALADTASVVLWAADVPRCFLSSFDLNIDQSEFPDPLGLETQCALRCGGNRACSSVLHERGRWLWTTTIGLCCRLESTFYFLPDL